jgi:hypothetical protein
MRTPATSEKKTTFEVKRGSGTPCVPKQSLGTRVYQFADLVIPTPPQAGREIPLRNFKVTSLDPSVQAGLAFSLGMTGIVG